VNTDVAFGVAVSVTAVPCGYATEHVPVDPPAVTLHAMPVGTLDTLPPPLPTPATFSVNGAENAAVTARACVIVTWHDPVPLHAPPHPANVLPPFAVAVRVTALPSS
jgi:hypothetical protein